MSQTPKKIVTFEPGEEFLLPFEAVDLRVWVYDEAGCEQIITDWSIDKDRLIIPEKYGQTRVTVACVPCPVVELPKFGNVKNGQFQEIIEQILDLIRFVEGRAEGALRVPNGDGLLCVDGGKVQVIPKSEALPVSDPVELPAKAVNLGRSVPFTGQKVRSLPTKKVAIEPPKDWLTRWRTPNTFPQVQASGKFAAPFNLDGSLIDTGAPVPTPSEAA